MSPDFSPKLRAWYRLNKRDLPWRHTSDPYRIWLSEVILQQTQVAQGLSYYLRFVERFPDVSSLARASEDEVLKMWQGLGYYSRARNLHEASRQIESMGSFPRDYASLRALKGVGDYTAAAVASFAYGLPHAVVDGNVQRVLSRHFGIYSAVNSSAGKKAFAAVAASVLPERHAAEHNQAIMELGALCCTPRGPNCGECPLSATCHANEKKCADTLPVKAQKPAQKHRYLNYIVQADEGRRVFLRRREKNDIWKGLYEFQLLETAAPAEETMVLESLHHYGKPAAIVHISRTYRHILSHQKLFARFFVVRAANGKQDGMVAAPVSELNRYAFPRLIDRFLSETDLSEML